MLEAMYDSSIQSNLFQHIDSLMGHSSYYEKNIDDIQDNEEVVKRIMLLSASYTFFDDLLKYHKHMNLSDMQIDTMVLKIDDLLDEFEPLTQATSTNSLMQDYFDKADSFYTLLVNAQVELGFHKVER
ncbi:MAG: hypothetical protein U9N52_05545 [Campylobacterota bacterium]|nr:hypothetical protein [Campylobacterota bacterium]